MAKPLTIYLIKWQAFHETEDVQCTVEIGDYDNLIPDDEAQDVYILQAAGEPARLSVIDNDENIFKVIRGQQLQIQFINSFNYNLSTFSEGSDRRWGVHYFVEDNTKTIFKGWLNIDDIQEPLLPYGGEVVTLTANDGLGSLRDVPLTNDDSENPKGKYRISQLLAYCLKKTGYNLELRVAFNIKQWGDTDDISIPNSVNEHLFSTTYLDALSFEDEINTCENCYDVIEKILGHEAWLFQSKGQWWIVRIDEVEQTRGLYITSFDADGNFIGNLGEVSFNKSIGATETIRLSEESSLIKNNRPKKSVRLNYNYDFPKEIPANVNFDRGEYVSDLSANEKLYYLENWAEVRLNETTGAEDDNDNEIRIVKKRDAQGTIEEQYVRMTEGTYSASHYLGVKCEPIPLKSKDKFDISFDWRLTPSLGVEDIWLCTLLFKGNSGTSYVWQWGSGNNPFDPPIYKWRNVASIPAYLSIGVTADSNESDYTTEWQPVSREIEGVPEDGLLYIYLFAHQSIAASPVTQYSNLRFEYKPFINGSHQLYQGQYCKTDRGNTDYAAKTEEDVSVSDAPNYLTKGSLLKVQEYNTVYSGSVTFTNLGSFSVTGWNLTKFYIGQILKITGTSNNNETEARVTAVAYSLIGGTTTVTLDVTTVAETVSCTIEEPAFSLASEFYNAAVFPSGAPTSDYNQRYGRIQLFDVWNQNYYDMRAIDATCQGLDLSELDGNSLPDAASMLNKWVFTDGSENLVNRYWMLLSYDQNHDNGGWTGYFREVFQANRDKDYSNFEFKYLEK